jgi:protein-S-isoprenylcysteine O-methyltransferase Ste14
MSRLVAKYAAIMPITTALVLLLQGDLFSLSPWVIAGQMLCLILAVSARLSFRNQQFRAVAEPGSGSLVRTGPYRVIRHPAYAGVLTFLLISVLSHLSLLNAGIWLVMLLVVLWRIDIEERFLSQRYPEYPEYRCQTRRLIPFVY